MLLILKVAMLTIAIGISLAAIGALGIVLQQLGKAPEGFEDESGFHVVKRAPGSKVVRSPGQQFDVATLRKRESLS
jgi:hypothetical protein